ncbi:MAG: hypothetical protein WC423_08190 [Vulcanimicrobiota bacterium]
MMPKALSSQLQPASIGLALAVLTILLGQFLGILFGLNEDMIKNHLEASAIQVRETVYQGDEAAMEKVLGKSWTYMKRAHLHAGSMGTTATLLIIVVSLLGVSRLTTQVTSLALGGGGLGYSLFWMWAGFRAPGMGGTGAAKESLRLLAMPTSGSFVLASVAVLVLVVMASLKPGPKAPEKS